MPSSEELHSEHHHIGAIPIIQHIIRRLDLGSCFTTYVPEHTRGRPAKLPHAHVLVLATLNLISEHRPLYAMAEWMAKVPSELIGLAPGQEHLLNDDRFGRALDRLYEVDPASLVTHLIKHACQEFDIDLEQIHNDSTTVTFSGAYQGQKRAECQHRPPLITFGHNKDHRPDLKQLVYCLTISRDGAIPIHFKTYDGNKTDDKTHIETWTFLRTLADRCDFVYVADSKLCTRENMGYIDERGGVFVTVLPRSRRESRDYQKLVQEGCVLWSEVRRTRGHDGPDADGHVYWAHEPGERTSEGYRLIIYRSSAKIEADAGARNAKIRRARDRLKKLEERSGPHRLRDLKIAQEAVDRVLKDEGAAAWLKVDVTLQIIDDLEQVSRGRPGRNTLYRKIEIPVILIDVTDDGEAIKAAARCDGLFAMVTNDENRTPREIFDIYKFQPFLEKRNEQLKSVLSIAPVFLKCPQRVAGLMLLNFVALLVHSLIERELRQAMLRENVRALPLYPEGRECRAPTARLVLDAFRDVRRTRVIGPDGSVVTELHDRLSELQRTVVRMLGCDMSHYVST